MSLSIPQRVALYTLLTSPKSSVRDAVANLAPNTTQVGALTDAVKAISAVLGINLSPADQQSANNDLTATLTSKMSKVIPPVAGGFLMTTDAQALTVLDPDYDDSTLCPTADSAAAMYQGLS